jgi:alpha-1,6-mannosyltransferase
LASLVIAGAVAVLTLVTIGELAGVGSGWLSALDVPGLVRSPLSIANLIGLGASGLLAWLGEDTAAKQALQIVRLVGMLTALGLIAVLGLRSSIHNAARAVGIALLAVVLLGPTAHDWYFVWCLPFLAVARPGRRLSTTLVGVSIVLTIAAPLNSSLRGAVIPILVTTSLVLVVAATLLGHLHTLQLHGPSGSAAGFFGHCPQLRRRRTKKPLPVAETTSSAGSPERGAGVTAG